MKENKNKPIETEDESLLEATNVSLKKDQLKALAVKLFGENAILRTWAYPELDREVCLGDMPYTIRIDSIEIKDGELKLMSEDLGGEIEQSALHWDDVEAISAMLKVASAAYEKKHEAVDLADKVWDRLNALMPVYGDKMKVSEPFTLTYPDRYLDSGEPCKVDSVVRSLRSSNLAKDTFYFGNKKGGVEIYDMSVTDLKTLIMPFLDAKEKELSDAKTKLFATILEAQKDLGDEISIAPTEISENGDKHVLTEILPDFESPFEDQNIIGGVSHLKDEDCVHNLALCLENVNDAEALGKAVYEAHVKHLEQDAKQAIRDRIVTPSARSFTANQVEILNRYHQVATPDTPANETFSRLLDEVAQESDVARKPEKWVTDTAKELNNLAEGITREESRGLHK